MKVIAIPTYRKSISLGGDLRKRLNIVQNRYATIHVASKHATKSYSRVYKIPLSTARALELAVRFSSMSSATRFDAGVFLPKRDMEYLGIKTGDAVGISTVSLDDAKAMLRAAATTVTVPDEGAKTITTVAADRTHSGRKSQAGKGSSGVLAPKVEPKTVKDAFAQYVNGLPLGRIDLDVAVTKLEADGFKLRGRPTLLEARRNHAGLTAAIVAVGKEWHKVKAK